MLAEVGYHIGAKWVIAGIVILLSFETLFMQIVYYVNHKRGVEPTFLRVLGVMSGRLTPISIGLTDEMKAMKLISMSKWLLRLHFCNKIIWPIVYLMMFSCYLNYDWSPSLILISLYPALFNSLWTYHANNILTTQLLVLTIFFYYVILKLKCHNK